jgi:hypothetical protein
MKRTLTLAALFALGAAAYAPLPSMAQTDFRLVVSSAPPAPRYEVVPAARHGYVWAPGHWEWRSNRHEWVGGYWIAERPGYAYAAPAWVRGDGGWQYQPARWNPYQRDRDRDGIPDRYESRGYGQQYGAYDRNQWRGHDRDRDGIPDRYERRRHDEDRDGIPNRYDRDRDGDGVANRYDRQPDNHWRR